MITVQCKKGQITVSGHAGYAEKGHDIVCAAVSILIYNLQNSIERLTEDTVGFSFCPDVTIIEYGKLSAQGRLLVGILGMALMPMGYLLVYTALSSVALAVAFRMIHGFALAFSNTSTSTIASDIIPKARFSEGMGMFGMATALATACAPAIGEMLMNKSFTILFGVSTGCMVLCLALFGFLNVPKLKIEHKPLNFKGLIDKDAMSASCVVLVFLLTYGALENYTLKFVSQTDKITLSGGVYFTVMAIMLFLTRVLIGKLADKKGEGIFVYSCNVLMLGALLLLAFVPNNVTFIISGIFSGFAFGGIEPALQAMAVNIAPPERRGAANSTFLCAYDIGIGIGGGIAGVLIDAVGYNYMFAIISVANIISIIIYYLPVSKLLTRGNTLASLSSSIAINRTLGPSYLLSETAT